MSDELHEKVWREREQAESERVAKEIEERKAKMVGQLVYCKYCLYFMNADVHRCRKTAVSEINYFERCNTYAKCEVKNKNNDCIDYCLGVYVKDEVCL